MAKPHPLEGDGNSAGSEQRFATCRALHQRDARHSSLDASLLAKRAWLAKSRPESPRVLRHFLIGGAAFEQIPGAYRCE
jgi:hypothetical protein